MASSDNSRGNILLHPWFPRTDPPLAGGSRSGAWQGRDQQTLGIIANSLVYEVASTRVNSLPSPWSRALQFQQAVLNSRYPTRDALLSELFGCFATIGLWDMFGVKLESERVALADYIRITDEAVGPFARCLQNSVPSPEQSLYVETDGSNPWETVHVLNVNGVVVCFTSPATLLCPAVHISDRIPGMNWTSEGRFTIPTPFLSEPQRQALADWLAHVRRELLLAPDRASQTMISQLASVIDGFIDSLTGGRLGNPVLSDNVVPNLPRLPTALKLLRQPADGGISDGQATIVLGDRRSRPLSQTPPKERPIVLVDRDMPKKLGLRACEITLYSNSTLEAIDYDKTQLERKYGNEIEVIVPEDLFLDELFFLPGEGALLNSWLPQRIEGKPLVNGQPVTPLLPLQERIRDLFSSEELAHACSMRLVQTGGGTEIETTLLLPLLGQRDPYPVTRSFPILERNLIDDDLPVIALWPNISDNIWNRFYLFCEDSATGLTVDGFAGYKLHTGREGGEQVKYFSTERFPDLVKLIEKGQPRGLIPVMPPLPTISAAAEWEVGIDFGTSFTNFFINDGEGPIRRPLDTRVIPLTLAQVERKQSLLYRYFIPETLLPAGENPPTSTALSLIGWQVVPGEVPEIYHQARVQWPPPQADALRGPTIKTGFKWRDIHYQKPFLKELALLISSNAAAAGATGIVWSVSYPSSFAPNEVRKYKRIWSDLSQDLTMSTGLRHQLAERDGEAGMQTEAVAFASYFGNHLGRKMVHTACFDVGGGTTDISLWQENTLLHQVSVPFAGRELCTGILQRKPSFIRFLLPPSFTAQIANDEARLRQDPNFTSWLDNCLRSASDELLSERLPIHRGGQNPQLLEFISLMAVGFGGLYHYLGVILRALDKSGGLLRRAPMPVYAGGNGARFLNWLDESGAFGRSCEADLLMERLQRLSCDFGDETGAAANTTLSGAYKDETACGLISRGVNLRGDFDPRDEAMVSGEEIRINNSIFGTLDRVIPPAEGKVAIYDLGNLSELRRFVENYDEAIATCRITSLLPLKKLTSIDTLWDEVETEVRSLCLEKVGSDVNELEPEPGFVLGLRALMRTLANQWAARY